MSASKQSKMVSEGRRVQEK